MSITARIDHVAHVPATYAVALSPPPVSAKIELTGRCNYKCTFCDHGSKEYQADMDRALYSRVIREMRDYGVRELGLFFVGESFLCKWLPEAIREAREVGFPYIFLTTNGSAARPEVVEACMAAGLDSLKFSINAATVEQFEAVMRVPGTLFDRALANLKEARRIRDFEGYSTRLYASSIRLDGEQGERMRGLIDAYVRPYVDEWYELPLYSWAGDRRDAEEAAGMQPTVGNQGRIGNLATDNPICWALTREAHITADGKLSACCFGSHPRFAMADLNSTSFADGWNSAAFQVLRQAHLDGKIDGTACETCIARQ